MSTTPPSTPSRFDAADEAVVEYHAVSPLAVLGLLTGLLSSTTLLGTSMWIVPMIGIPLNVWALWQIAVRSPALVGRGAAVWGLALSTLFFVYVPVESYCYRRMLSQEARQVAAAWFEAVRRNDPVTVHRLMSDPRQRAAPTIRPAAYYKANPRAAEALKKIVDEPLVRTLFALGKSAEARYFEQAGYVSIDSTDAVQETYAVTFDQDKRHGLPAHDGKLPDGLPAHEEDHHGQDAHATTTFFVVVFLERQILGDKAQWHIGKVEGPIHPAGWNP